MLMQWTQDLKDYLKKKGFQEDEYSIKKMDRNLEKGGDVRIIFIQSRGMLIDLRDFRSVPEIKKIEGHENHLTIYFDRISSFKANIKINNRPSGDINIVNFDEQKHNSSPLTSFRAKLLSNVLPNIISSSQHVGISSTDLDSQLRTLGSPNIGVRVGAVLGKDGKKEEVMTVNSFKDTAKEFIERLDSERCDENEKSEERTRRLETLTSSWVTFALLGSSIYSPVKIDFTAQNSSFVLYNIARISRLLQTYDEMVREGQYPPREQNIDYSLLKEPEEWELFYNFILPCHEVISDCGEDRSLHKLIAFLIKFASTYSRYYNRVKVLKEVVPNLFPQVIARIWLLDKILDTFTSCLSILNLHPLRNM